MYEVKFYNNGLMDDFTVFTGSLADCEMYVELFQCEDDEDELFIVEPDGVTVVD